jgi:hypothetical protein
VDPSQKFKCLPFWSDRRHLQYHHLHTKFHPYPPTGSKVSYTHLRSLNVRHFEMVEATELNSMESRSSSMSSSPYKISSTSTKRFKSYYGVSLRPPQKFKCRPFWNGWSYEIKKCDVEVTLNVGICLPNFVKIHWSVQNLLEGDKQTQTRTQTHRHTDTHTHTHTHTYTHTHICWWLDKPTFITCKQANKNCTRGNKRIQTI